MQRRYHVRGSFGTRYLRVVHPNASLLLVAFATGCNAPAAPARAPAAPSKPEKPPASEVTPSPPETPAAPTAEERDARCRAATRDYEAALLPQWDACTARCRYKDVVGVVVYVDRAGHVKDVQYRGGTVCGPAVARCVIDAARRTPLDAEACASWSFEVRRDEHEVGAR
jgi:hypothetical protein